MWSTRKRKSGSRLGHDKRGIPAFDTVSLHSNLGSPRRNYFSIITTDLNVLHFGSITSKRLLKLLHWWLKNKERKVDFRFVERKFLAAINLTGSAEGALVPVLLRITHWTKSGLPVSPPGLFPPRSNSSTPVKSPSKNTGLLLSEIFKDPPIVPYKKGKSLKIY